LSRGPSDDKQRPQRSRSGRRSCSILPGIGARAWSSRCTRCLRSSRFPSCATGDSRTLVIERTNGAGERIAIDIDESLANGGFYDLGRQGVQLKSGAHYAATLASRKLNFRVDGKATSKSSDKASNKPGSASKAPIVSRLLRFPPA